MAKKVKTWEDHLKDARHYNALTSQSLAKTVRLFMAEKGFCKEAVELFDMNFASGCETVITFDSEGEMCDLDIKLFDENIGVGGEKADEAYKQVLKVFMLGYGHGWNDRKELIDKMKELCQEKN